MPMGCGMYSSQKGRYPLFPTASRHPKLYVLYIDSLKCLHERHCRKSILA